MTRAEKSGGGRTTFILSAALIGLLAIAAVVVLIINMNRGGEPGPSPTPPPSSSDAAPPTETAVAESICGLPAGSADIPTAPPQTSWSVIGRTPVPDSTTAGPGLVEPSGLRHCFARGAEGALFAAANLTVASIEGVNREEIAEQLVAEGPGREIAIAQAGTPVDQQTFGMAIEGFRVLEYTDSTARIDFALRLTTGEYISSVVDLRWEDGDWKMVLADDGSPLTDPVQLQSAGGYITWSNG